jgi:hypothetical protein
MIRAATFRDIPEIETMIGEMLAASKYAARMKLCAKDMRQFCMGLCHQQRSPLAGGSFLRIAEKADTTVAFMAGVLQPVYFVGDRLEAIDVFLYARPNAGSAASRLIDEYIAWASAHPKVIEIKLSWTDALPGAAKVGKLYQRKGASLSGEFYEITPDVSQEVAA